MAKLLTTVPNGPGAELISARLREAGIHAEIRSGPWGADAMAGGTRDIFVDDLDLDRARAVLESDEGLSEEELVQAEEQRAAATGAQQSAPAQRGEEATASAPKRGLWDRILGRSSRSSSADAFGPKEGR
jgi:hypothetical protein